MEKVRDNCDNFKTGNVSYYKKNELKEPMIFATIFENGLKNMFGEHICFYFKKIP